MMRCVRAAGQDIHYELVQTVRQSLELRATAGGAKVFAPRGVKLRAVDDFVRERADWLLEANRQLQQYHKDCQARHPIAQGAPILVGGQVVRLNLDESGAMPQGLDGGALTVDVSGGRDPRAQVKALLVDMAKSRIEARLRHFVPIVGRAPVRVTIREQRTRWGSCSNLNNLNFNWKLVMAPPEALDYVVVHELCHLYELNHSRRFWARVAQVMPDYGDWVRWLKENGHMLGV